MSTAGKVAHEHSPCDSEVCAIAEIQTGERQEAADGAQQDVAQAVSIPHQALKLVSREHTKFKHKKCTHPAPVRWVQPLRSRLASD